MDRFQAATDQGLDAFVKNQQSSNMRKSTENAVNLLGQYKVQAFNYAGGYDTLEMATLVKLLKSFYQKVCKEDGQPYEPGSLRTMHYGILRHLREQYSIEFTDSENRDIVSHLGAVNKNLRKLGKGSLPNKSDALTSLETNLLFEKGAAEGHHPIALRNAIQMFSLILGRRGSSEQRSLCFGDMHVIVVNGHQFLTLNGERVSKSRQYFQIPMF